MIDKPTVELSVHTKISEMDSVLSLREFIHTVSHWGWKTVAITDPASIQTFPEAMRLVEHRHQGIKIIYGMEGRLTRGTPRLPYLTSLQFWRKIRRGFNIYMSLFLYRISNLIMMSRKSPKDY